MIIVAIKRTKKRQYPRTPTSVSLASRSTLFQNSPRSLGSR